MATSRFSILGVPEPGCQKQETLPRWQHPDFDIGLEPGCQKQGLPQDGKTQMFDTRCAGAWMSKQKLPQDVWTRVFDTRCSPSYSTRNCFRNPKCGTICQTCSERRNNQILVFAAVCRNSMNPICDCCLINLLHSHIKILAIQNKIYKN